MESRRIALMSLLLLPALAGCADGAAQGATSAAGASSTSFATSTSSSTSTVASTTTTTTSTTSTTTTVATTPPAPTTVPEVSVLDRPLVAVGGSDGEETTRIQTRLLELGFWHLGADGNYGHTTKQAVMAFQKWAGLDPSGRVDEPTANVLTTTMERPRGQSSDLGVLVEVDKDRQLLFIMNNGRLEWALNTSTGDGQYYLEPNQKDPTKWELGRSVTHSGRFKVNRERADGWWEGDLGEIYRPKYFNGGIAVHGSRNIPNYPASHGCVRVSTAAMDMIWASGLVPKGTPVWVYGADIEAEGEPPVMPTTTTSTTTVPISPDSTTVAPT